MPEPIRIRYFYDSEGHLIEKVEEYAPTPKPKPDTYPYGPDVRPCKTDPDNLPYVLGLREGPQC